jgi:hypothetical protein
MKMQWSFTATLRQAQGDKQSLGFKVILLFTTNKSI